MAENEIKKVVVRMAPSPTGLFHVGSARTALFNFLFARKHGGTFIFRSEDTNDERSKKEYEDNIVDSLKWLGLNYDEFVRQSERSGIYRQYIQKMLDNGSAYISKEEPKKEGQRSEVIRLKNPNKKIVFDDVIRGKIEFDTTESGDFVIAKSVDEPLYHLAVVIDDHEMGITHIIRGEDILSSTPRHILIQEAIGALQPIYAHIPLILAPDRSKLSKRYGATSITEYKEKGYLAPALINFLALLGWNPGTPKEIFTLDELIHEFDLSKVQKGGAIFDEEKLKWFNKEHMKMIPEETVIGEIKAQIASSARFIERRWKIDESVIKRGYKSIFERINVWQDVSEMANSGDLDYLFERPDYDAPKLFWRDEKDKGLLARHINEAISAFDRIDTGWRADNVKNSIWEYAEKEGKGSVLWPIRFSLSGKEKSPDPFSLSEILGKEETIERLKIALHKISKY